MKKLLLMTMLINHYVIAMDHQDHEMIEFAINQAQSLENKTNSTLLKDLSKEVKNFIGSKERLLAEDWLDVVFIREYHKNQSRSLEGLYPLEFIGGVRTGAKAVIAYLKEHEPKHYEAVLKALLNNQAEQACAIMHDRLYNPEEGMQKLDSIFEKTRDCKMHCCACTKIIGATLGVAAVGVGLGLLTSLL